MTASRLGRVAALLILCAYPAQAQDDAPQVPNRDLRPFERELLQRVADIDVESLPLTATDEDVWKPLLNKLREVEPWDFNESAPVNTADTIVSAADRTGLPRLDPEILRDLALLEDQAQRTAQIAELAGLSDDAAEVAQMDAQLFNGALGFWDQPEPLEVTLGPGSGLILDLVPEARGVNLNLYDLATGVDLHLPLLVTQDDGAAQGNDPTTDEDDIFVLDEPSGDTNQDVAWDDDSDLFNTPLEDTGVNLKPHPDARVATFTPLELSPYSLPITGAWIDPSWTLYLSSPGAEVDSLPQARPSDQELAGRISEIDAALEAAGKVPSFHTWRNSKTGEEVLQERFRRINDDDWDYIGENPDPDAFAEIERLKKERSKLIELMDSPDDTQSTESAATLSNFDRTHSSLDARALGAVLDGKTCREETNDVRFDGRTLTYQHQHRYMCHLSSGIPAVLRQKIIAAGDGAPHRMILRVTWDPFGEDFTLRGRAYTGQVEFNPDGPQLIRYDRAPKKILQKLHFRRPTSLTAPEVERGRAQSFPEKGRL